MRQSLLMRTATSAGCVARFDDQRSNSDQQNRFLFQFLRSVDPVIGQAGTEPHANQRQPGGEGEDRGAGDAGADRAAAGQHAAEAHADGADDVAAHAVAVLEAFQFEFLAPQGGEKRAEDDAGNQADVEIPWLAGRRQREHQHVGGRPGKAQALHRDDVEGLRADLEGKQPGESDHHADTDAAQPFASVEAGALGEMDGGGEPYQAEQKPAEVAKMEGGEQIAGSAAFDGPQA